MTDDIIRRLREHAQQGGDPSVCLDAISLIETLSSELARLEEPATFYHFLRDQTSGVDEPCVFDTDDANVLLQGPDLDRAIIAALGAQP